MAQLQFNGDLLRQRREERGLYLKDVAAAVGYSAAAVGQWETGKRNPSATAAKKLADFFGVDSAAFWIDPTAPAHDFTIKTQGDLLRAIRALANAGMRVRYNATEAIPGKLTISYTPTEGKSEEAIANLVVLLTMQHSGAGINSKEKDGVIVPTTWGTVIDAWMDRNLPELDKLPLTGAEPPAGEE